MVISKKMGSIEGEESERVDAGEEEEEGKEQDRLSLLRDAIPSVQSALKLFEGIKKLCGNGHRHSLGFKNKVFSYVKTLGHVFEGMKSPCGNGHAHSLGFKNTVFSYVKTLGRVFGDIKAPAGMATRTP